MTEQEEYLSNGPYTKFSTECKFCKKPITIEISQSYFGLNDPFKLLPLASCNKCSDLRVERIGIENSVKRVAMILHLAGRNRSSEMVSRSRDSFIKLTQKYANLIARWNGMDGGAWDVEGVELLLDKPDHWSKILGEFWKMFTDSQRHRA